MSQTEYVFLPLSKISAKEIEYLELAFSNRRLGETLQSYAQSHRLQECTSDQVVDDLVSQQLQPFVRRLDEVLHFITNVESTSHSLSQPLARLKSNELSEAIANIMCLLDQKAKFLNELSTLRLSQLFTDTAPAEAAPSTSDPHSTTTPQIEDQPEQIDSLLARLQPVVSAETFAELSRYLKRARKER